MHADNVNFAHTRISAVVKRYAKYDMGDSLSRTVQNDSTSNSRVIVDLFMYYTK